ncbi:hypothetical protein WN943_000522 [Citrus x changshan-huyou]
MEIWAPWPKTKSSILKDLEDIEFEINRPTFSRALHVLCGAKSIVPSYDGLPAYH